MTSDARPAIVRPGVNCWRIERADRARMIIDAADYFALLKAMMEQARERVLLIGWDFDPRIALAPQSDGNGEPLGRFLPRLARDNPRRKIEILRWSFGGLKLFLNPRILAMYLRWRASRAISFRLDSKHPLGCSHHQKVAVFDDHLAICGGIDAAGGRWDTPEHRDDQPCRRMGNGKPAPPWHDATMLLAGDVGNALADLGKERWRRATQSDLPRVSGRGVDWPDGTEAEFSDVDVAIARTRAEYEDADEIREIERLYLDMIAAARRYIYFENQYFTNGKIAAAIAERMKEDNPPEFVIVMPRTADGWLEQRAMDAARVRLARIIGKVDLGDRFRIYVPVTQGGEDIYVHAKVAIMDGDLLRVGSANLNNRSMGLDSECDVIIDGALPANAAVGPAIEGLLHRLLGEHLDVAPDAVAAKMAETGSLVDAIEALRGTGKTLDLLDLEKPGSLDAFIADNELLDPDSPDAMFEGLAERGLRKSWHRGRDWVRRRSPFRRRAAAR